LTGGIASGKSAASNRFAQNGIPVIDADKVGHDVIAPGGIAEAAVIDAFGQGIVRCGKIDRDALGAIVFRDDEARIRLNGIVHPAIRAEIAARLAALGEAGTSAAIVDAALHAENGQMPPGFEALILVTCPAEERQRRLVENRAMTPEAAMDRINAQLPPESKAPLARWIVDNSGSLEALYAQVDRIAAEIQRDAA
jgi:dephospho-CoA kinase